MKEQTTKRLGELYGLRTRVEKNLIYLTRGIVSPSKLQEQLDDLSAFKAIIGELELLFTGEEIEAIKDSSDMLLHGKQKI